MEYSLENFPDSLKAEIKVFVSQAELLTSGEIRVFLEDRCSHDVLDRAAEIFAQLKMHATADRNGVLFYLALKDHKFAILGDVGINEKVPAGFWEVIKDQMQAQLHKGDFLEGLRIGLDLAGKALGEWFPRSGDDVNELSDDVIIGK